MKIVKVMKKSIYKSNRKRWNYKKKVQRRVNLYFIFLKDAKALEVMKNDKEKLKSNLSYKIKHKKL